MNERTKAAILEAFPTFELLMLMSIHGGNDPKPILENMEKHIETGDAESAELLQQEFRDIAIKARKIYVEMPENITISPFNGRMV